MAKRRLSDEERLNHKRASQRAYLKTEKGKATSKKARKVWRSTKEGHDWLYQDRKNYYGRTKHLSQGRRIWTDEECELVLNFEGTDEELAYKIGRSVAAIQTRRWMLKKEDM